MDSVSSRRTDTVSAQFTSFNNTTAPSIPSFSLFSGSLQIIHTSVICNAEKNATSRIGVFFTKRVFEVQEAYVFDLKQLF